MRAGLPITVAVIGAVSVYAPATGGGLCRADSFAYIERWAGGTLTTGDPFESWRIHVVVADGDDWTGAAIDGWLTAGPTWYDDPMAELMPRPDLFETYPDAEFATYFTTPFLHPNSDVGGNIITSADGVFEQAFLHLGAWAGDALAGSGDYVLFQGTVLNPVPEIYGSIQFAYGTLLEPEHYYTFVIPEPATGVLLVLVACCLPRRRQPEMYIRPSRPRLG
jgi:hypothetical protein